jgi:hypothetical protein
VDEQPSDSSAAFELTRRDGGATGTRMPGFARPHSVFSVPENLLPAWGHKWLLDMLV